jgi:acyl-coenzyme A thioesterase PaaI-like protein
MAFTDEQMRALLRDPANHPPSARHLGFELIDFSVESGWAEVAFTPRAEFANPAGAVQGGFVCAMLDDAMGVTASISQRFLRPTPMSRVIGRGEVLRMGSATAHLQGSLRLPDGTLLATATASAVLRPFPKP